jgi:FKBP-type peptidyl-prolyl cis-trans isomerase
MVEDWAVLDEVHLTKDRGLIKKILRRGDADGPEPQNNQEVTVEYTGRLVDGTEFDSSKKHGEPLKFILG